MVLDSYFVTITLTINFVSPCVKMCRQIVNISYVTFLLFFDVVVFVCFVFVILFEGMGSYKRLRQVFEKKMTTNTMFNELSFNINFYAMGYGNVIKQVYIDHRGI